MRNIWYNVKNFFININNWFKVIINQRDYDYSHLYVILRHKIYLMRKNFTYEKDNTRSIIVINRMDLCIKLLDRLIDSYYENESYEYYELDMSFEKIINSNNTKINFEIIYDNLDVYFDENKTYYLKAIEKRPELKEIKNRTSLAHEISSMKHKKAKKILFKCLEYNIEGWWD